MNLNSTGYDPLNCWITCTDLYECLRDENRLVSEICCSSCGQGNRYRVPAYLKSMLEKKGTVTKCQMGRGIIRAPDELCDACRGGELVQPVELNQVQQVAVAQAETLIETPVVVQDVPTAITKRALVEDPDVVAKDILTSIKAMRDAFTK